MAVSESAVPRTKRGFFRFWLPRILVVLWLLDLLTIWFWPSETFDKGQRVFSTVAGTLLFYLLMGIWLLLFSGLAWKWRLLLLVAPVVIIGGGAVGAIRTVHFRGDMAPIFQFRWEPGDDDNAARVEADREQQAKAGSLGPIVISNPLPTDFPEYRGRLRDGIVQGPPLARDWQKQPPRRLWQYPVGGGYAAFAVAGNVAVTIEQRRDKEAVVCYDTASGRERWKHEYAAYFKEPLGGNGPRATPTIAEGDVYSLGATGKLVCLEGTTGRLKWSAETLENNDNIMWGMSGSPLVYDQVVVVNPGAQRASAAGHALIAYNRADGKVVWNTGKTKAAYSSPMLATLAGRKQILIFDAGGLAGCDAAKGEELWRVPWTTYQDINVAQPLVLEGDRVFISSGYEHGCAMVHVKETGGKWSTEVKENTSSKGLRCKFSNPVFYQGYIYGLDESRLVCLDAGTLEQKWKTGSRYGHGQLLLAGDLLVILAESGKLALVEATPSGHHELGSVPALEGEKTWNYPALADGKVYVRNAENMACFDLTGHSEQR
jgi:outer membrane protein assembly factor BamB